MFAFLTYTTAFVSSIQMIDYERTTYVESVILCFLFYAQAFTGIPGCGCNTSPHKNILRGCQTTGKVAAFSIHSNKFNLAGYVFIIVSPQPCLGSWWLSGIVLDLRSNGSGFKHTGDTALNP